MRIGPLPSRPSASERPEASPRCGLVFLWAFLDKAFGFGYSTPVAVVTVTAAAQIWDLTSRWQQLTTVQRFRWLT